MRRMVPTKDLCSGQLLFLIVHPFLFLQFQPEEPRSTYGTTNPSMTNKFWWVFFTSHTLAKSTIII